jgi:hypothetical protein
VRPYIVVLTLSTWALVACGDTSSKTAERPADAAPAPAADAGSPAGGSSAAEVPGGATPIEITAVVDGKELTASGPAQCEHTADGSIYQRPAALWIVRFDGEDESGIRHLSISFWREKSGEESVTLALQAGNALHRIATVPGGERQGSGKARLEGDAAGGTLVVEGTSGEGGTVRIRARCERFTPLVAEGG